ncbi:MAG: hypothetical protein SWI22_15040 [Pseudomonadota bacterium]|nr:hypothetical protein [Pseudomonadota bacterium]
MISRQVRKLGLVGAFMAGAAIIATPLPAAAAPTACMRLGLSTCDPIYARFSTEWWLCYNQTVEECEALNPPSVEPLDPPGWPWPWL